jgi:methionine-rich copper-binding protein CopC
MRGSCSSPQANNVPGLTTSRLTAHKAVEHEYVAPLSTGPEAVWDASFELPFDDAVQQSQQVYRKHLYKHASLPEPLPPLLDVAAAA